MLAATNGYRQEAVGMVRIPVGQGIEGVVARRIEPIMLKDFAKDGRFKEAPGLALSSYSSLYCLPLYVYSNGALMGVIELLYANAKTFTDEEIKFFTTLAGILSNTMQNEELQAELRNMNIELEQWVTEKTEELRKKLQEQNRGGAPTPGQGGVEGAKKAMQSASRAAAAAGVRPLDRGAGAGRQERRTAIGSGVLRLAARAASGG